jgi:hypothetical protein
MPGAWAGLRWVDLGTDLSRAGMSATVRATFELGEEREQIA